jgi:ABC-type multidrug transport system ATPase subunit
MMALPVVQVDSIGKTYAGGVRALEHVSFQVAEGETFGILGVNGAGKTTLIRIVSTLMRPSHGRVTLFGRTEGAAIRRRMGVVSQDCTLDPHLTVRRNLFFHALFFGLSGPRRKRRMDEALSWLGLEHCADAAIHTLSGGTKRKVMIARALLAEPDLLILDEPTTGLDPEARAVVWSRLRACAAAGTTILLSTHHRDEAEALCHRVGVIEAGRMADGHPDTLDAWFAKAAAHV